MKKQKTIFATIIFFGLFFALFFSGEALAAGSATVSWIAPTLDAEGGALTDLAGYKIFYSTSLNTCPVYSSSGIDVSDEDATDYFINNTLTAGQTYNFTLMAYDTSGNYSTCAASGGDTYFSKQITYSGDINATPDNKVDINDFTLLADDYGEAICGSDGNKADINHDCQVDINDFTILADDYGESF